MLIHGFFIFLLLGLKNDFAFGWETEIKESPSFTPNEVGLWKQTNDAQKDKSKNPAQNNEIGTFKIIHEKRDVQKDMPRDPIMSMLDSLLQPLMVEGETKKKPKMKTIMSLTEIITPPKHIHLGGSGHLSSPFGMKDGFFMDDPFDELSHLMNFMPNFNRVGLIMPLKQSKDRCNKTVGENGHFKMLSPRHIKIITHDDQTTASPHCSQALQDRNQNNLNIEGQFMQIHPLNEEKLADEEINVIDDMVHTCPIVKALPYIIGALGGVMTALILVVLVTWRTKRTNTVWERIPFIESTVPEKV